MKSDTRFVQYIKGTDQATSQRGRQIDTLAFPAGKGGGQTIERQVTQPHVQQELQAVGDLRQQPFGDGCLVLVELKGIEKGFRFRDRESDQFRNILPAHLYIQGFGAQAGTFAGRANGSSRD